LAIYTLYTSQGRSCKRKKERLFSQEETFSIIYAVSRSTVHAQYKSLCRDQNIWCFIPFCVFGIAEVCCIHFDVSFMWSTGVLWWLCCYCVHACPVLVYTYIKSILFPFKEFPVLVSNFVPFLSLFLPFSVYALDFPVFIAEILHGSFCLCVVL
jgi:ABC-type uncharacterized transport system permease subunit